MAMIHKIWLIVSIKLMLLARLTTFYRKDFSSFKSNRGLPQFTQWTYHVCMTRDPCDLVKVIWSWTDFFETDKNQEKSVNR